MNADKKKMALAFLPTSAPFSWRHPAAQAESDVNFEHVRHLAETAERGKFDILFLADSYGLREDRLGLGGMTGFGNMLDFEALTLLGALAAVTKRIGLVATASTTYNEPYNLARKLATIDHISQGRAGWNVITSSMDAEAYNYGLAEQISTEVRYERAGEFLDVVRDLWDSWEDEAIVRDRAAHRYFDASKVHRLDHRGRHFKVRGPLNLPRPPQGHPIICQAGASEIGWDFAARTADVMYGKAISLGEAQRFYAEVKGRMPQYGRTPEQLKILPGLVAVAGKTEKEAREKFRAVQNCLSEKEGRGLLAQRLPGFDFSNLALDDPLPRSAEIEHAAKKGRYFLEREGRRLTVRELIDYVSAGIGHLTLIGSAGQIAETMVSWFEENGADGFNLMPHYLPGGLEDFVDLVIPELQARGVFRTEYEGTTLRDNLGLSRPQNRLGSG
jgi:FMN-dependent oxidoreductase (nitrilotriacetate monooxygenase family)